MTVLIDCKCGWFLEQLDVTDLLEAELLADRHERRDIKRPYRHDTHVEAVAA